MPNRKIYHFLIILFFFMFYPCINASADHLDSLLLKHDTSTVYRFTASTDSLALKNLRLTRTYILDGFQKYTQLDRRSRFYSSLGNTGLAYKDLIFQPVGEDGFYLGLNSFDAYTFRSRNTNYYVHRKPVTYLFYANGAKKEQLFRAIHSNKIGKIITIGFDFNLINSPGYYAQQKSDDKSVVVTGQYYTKNLRYGILANYSHNKFIVLESGGIRNDSMFENNLESDRRLIDVNLQTAQNMVKEAGVSVNQYFYLSKARPKDTTGTHKPIFHAGRLAYTFDYIRQIQVYTDQEQNSDFYLPYNPPIYALKTYDSLHVEMYENTLSWSNLRLNDDPEHKPFYLNFSLKNQYTEMSGYEPKRIFMVWIPGVDLVIRPYKGFHLDFHGTYIQGDFNNGGYRLIASASQQIMIKSKDFGKLSVDISRTDQEPGWFYEHYHSNHFRWDNEFQKIVVSQAGFNYLYKHLSAGVNYYTVNNFTYLDSLARPAQYSGKVNVLDIYLYKDFKIGVWNLDNALVYQKASQTSVIHLPEFMANISFYATLALFKNAAILQPGLEFFYNTSYYADAYMPATRSFYLQDAKKVGNYVYSDVFVNLMIKKFRFFIKYANFTSWFGRHEYFMVPHYPMEDASIIFGLSWSFYD